jgi:drug/metabolite transporter (DMT)-like permease
VHHRYSMSLRHRTGLSIPHSPHTNTDSDAPVIVIVSENSFSHDKINGAVLMFLTNVLVVYRYTKSNKMLSSSPHQAKASGSSSSHPSRSVTFANAALYVLSGCSQPLIMTLCKQAGLADPECQLYMLFYYLGPASVILGLNVWEPHIPWPSAMTILKACGIALFDICATSMNYTGASLAGPTIFAIVYSSVTVWTAVFSRIFLGRSMIGGQWCGVVTVFGGLALTATDSLTLGDDVVTGLFLVIAGSAMHALTYVMSEGIMTVGEAHETLTILQNCAVQGIVACVSFLVWQIVFTIPRWHEKISEPMQQAGSTIWYGLYVLLLFFGANLIHSVTFMHTLRHYPGGSTSAGVMKGLQAVLVFVVTHFAYCGHAGGQEMCFTRTKFVSLITVVSGVSIFGLATEKARHHLLHGTTNNHGLRAGYERIDVVDGSIEV